MHFDARKTLLNVRLAETEDLLDRLTVYREGVEAEALDIIRKELWSRGVTSEQIEAHAQQWERRVIRSPNGMPAKCSFCHRPAVAEGWGWHRLLGLIPLFPRWYHYCPGHQPIKPAPSAGSRLPD